MKYTKREMEAMKLAVYEAGENATPDYIEHNIELGYIDVVEGRSGRLIADYMDMDGHEGRVYVDTLEIKEG